MKTAIIILLALVASGQAWFDHDEEITVKFGVVNSFYKVPKTIKEAEKEKWIKAPQHDEVPEIYKELEMYCYGCDGPICPLYEPHSGYIAGMQIGLNREYFYDFSYNITENGFKEWTWTCDGVARTFDVIRQYYITGEHLSKSPLDRKIYYDKTVIVQNKYVVTEFPGGVLKYFSTDRTKMTNETAMTKQQCIPGMGTHYYYNMTPALEFSAETIKPWFLLYDGDKLIGCCLMTFAKVKQYGSRDWFEHPPKAAVEAIVPHASEDFYKHAESPGAQTMHIYFKHNALITGC